MIDRALGVLLFLPVPIVLALFTRVPFPVHIQALIGTWAVLWLFRLVGLVWLVQGLLHFATRT